ncbi:PTS lactose/cellobiose transporter subunit IIA [Bacillus salipaludis]|uniref:PTS lactose/cellobiose transporter subunit IIA n=1 Tax=Bacillus salipaludis TaxID=2547811 RepID=A0AA90TS20_9BACI|nr:PTS lactose/cellobiose transporter subunit IIA [Bacillus salipaludis]MDQ6600586.1 PTS lactose/cellobiose transporter subunit IIA [Bacillus salipaludis]
MTEDVTRENKLNEISMQIILHAGDARVVINEALECVAGSLFKEAEEKLTEAKKKITFAHSSQTKTIQGEALGEKIPFSLLFAHAQDTLMTIMSEWNTAKQLVNLFKVYDARLKKLEEK